MIQNLYNVPVTITGLTLNGHNDGTTGSPNIIAQGDDLLEQEYFLIFCDGKKLQARGTPGDSCKIPLQFIYSNDPTLAKTTFTVTAAADADSSNPTLASFTVDTTKTAPATFTLYNVNNPNYRLRSTAPNPIVNSDLVLVFFDATKSVPPASFAYTIQNTSSVAQTFITRCAYQIHTGDYPSFPPPNNITNNQCTNMSLAPGGSCSGSLTMNPNGYYGSTANVYIGVSVDDPTMPVPSLSVLASGPSVFANYLFNGWNDP